MIIRAKTFRAWMRANFDNRELAELSQHGADTGWHGLTWISDAAKLFDRFGDEVWTLLRESADDQGETVPGLLAKFRRVDMAADLDSFKNLVIWFAAEEIARDLTEGRRS